MYNRIINLLVEQEDTRSAKDVVSDYNKVSSIRKKRDSQPKDPLLNPLKDRLVLRKRATRKANRGGDSLAIPGSNTHTRVSSGGASTKKTSAATRANAASTISKNTPSIGKDGKISTKSAENLKDRIRQRLGGKKEVIKKKVARYTRKTVRDREARARDAKDKANKQNAKEANRVTKETEKANKSKNRKNDSNRNRNALLKHRIASEWRYLGRKAVRGASPEVNAPTEKVI